MQNNRFREKYGPWSLITGASSGLGAAFAERLAQMGLNLVLLARREDRLRELSVRLQREYRILIRVIAVDLSDPDFIHKVIQETEELEVGLLINNAGYSRTGKLLQGDLEDERKMYRVNCEAPLMLAMAFGKKMEGRGKGGIIFVSSSVAFAPVPYWTHYAATKAYTMFLGEGMFHELKTRGIDVLALCPGGMKTEFQQIAGISSMGAMHTRPVVNCALRSLGRKPSVVPGRHISFLFQQLPKILPRRINLLLYGYMISKLMK